MPRKVKIGGHIVELPEGVESDNQVQLYIRNKSAKDPNWYKPVDTAQDVATIVGPRGLSHPKDIQLEEALPAVGGALGAAVGTPGGPAGAIAGATIGGAGGEAARQLINRAIGDRAPATGSEALDDVMIRGGIEGAIEGGTRLVGGALKAGTRFLGNRVLARDAGKALAEELSSNKMSPKQLGDELQAMFDTTVSKESDALRAFKEGIAKANPNIHIPYSESLKTVKSEIARLHKSISDKPNAGQIDPTTGKNSRESALLLLTDLEKKYSNANFTKSPNLQDVFGERSEAFNMSEIVKGELQGFESNLSKAIHSDIGSGLKAANKGKEFLEFESKSSRLRSVLDLGEQEKHKTLAKIFGDKRLDAEKVADILSEVPEDAVDAIKVLRQQGGEAAVAPVRKAIFLKILEKDTAGNNMVAKFLTDDTKAREIFGASANKVQKFAKAVEEAEMNTAGGGKIKRLINYTTLPIAKLMGGNVRVGINDAAGLVLEIPGKRLAEFLDNPQVFDEFLKATGKDASSARVAQLIRVLEGAALSMQDRKTEGITTIGEYVSTGKPNNSQARRARLQR